MTIFASFKSSLKEKLFCHINGANFNAFIDPDMEAGISKNGWIDRTCNVLKLGIAIR